MGINETLKELSEQFLEHEENRLILEIIEGIVSESRDEYFIKLSEVLGVKPKRPLYYIADEITRLPEHGTRNIMRYCGDYIDQLVRFTLEDKKYFARWFKRPLGPNLNKLKKFINQDLYENLSKFNKIYTQAKHDFNHYEDKSLFNYQDAVYMIFVTKKLAGKILPLSERARDYNNQGETCYSYNPVDK